MKPNCPLCGGQLEKVRYPSDSYMNEDQFNSVKAGDWYCSKCKSDKASSGYAYFWDSEVKPMPGGAK